MAEIVSSNVKRWTPTDPRQASSRLNWQPRAGSDNARGIASWNVGTMKRRSLEVVETLERRNVDICCVQEVRFRGKQSRLFEGKEMKYKFTWSGNDEGTYGVGVLIAEKWISSILEVNRISDRIIHLRLNLGKTLVSIVSMYMLPKLDSPSLRKISSMMTSLL